jgi:DNA-binding transcriptional LysR family regulator
VVPMARPKWDWESRIGRRLRLRDLHILSTVVRCGSMAKAAPHLAMSQPAVSEAIANLEQALDVRLLDRSPHGVEPTIYARALLKRGHVVFDELRQGIKDIEFLTDPSVGEVRIGCPEILSGGFLAATIDRFSRQHPQVVVGVIQTDVSTLEFRELRERKVDLLLARIAGAVEDDLDVESLFDDPHFVVAGEQSPWARPRKVALAELVNEPWIFSPGQVWGMVVSEAFKAHGLEAPSAKVIGGSLVLRNQLLATGRFLTMLPKSVLRYHAEQWSLKVLPIDLRIKPRPIAIVTLKNRTLSPVVELFAEHFRAVSKMI